MDTVDRLLSNEENDALGVTLVVAPPAESSVGENPVRVEVLIDGARLAATQENRRTESGIELLQLEVYVYALDDAGGVRDLFAQTLSTNLADLPEGLGESGFRASGILALPPGSYLLRTLVRDRTTPTSTSTPRWPGSGRCARRWPGCTTTSSGGVSSPSTRRRTCRFRAAGAWR
jgi:hypothetical protein